MPRKIVAIQVNTSPVRYVTAYQKKFNGSFLVEYSENENLAHDFESQEKANQFIPKIDNPFSREFKIVSKSVSQPVRIGEIMDNNQKIA
jgi:hypothetical protein